MTHPTPETPVSGILRFHIDKHSTPISTNIVTLATPGCVRMTLWLEYAPLYTWTPTHHPTNHHHQLVVSYHDLITTTTPPPPPPKPPKTHPNPLRISRPPPTHHPLLQKSNPAPICQAFVTFMELELSWGGGMPRRRLQTRDWLENSFTCVTLD